MTAMRWAVKPMAAPCPGGGGRADSLQTGRGGRVQGGVGWARL